ncbi:MAG: methyl-accepting chemotaxis protein, partial [Verrucomicrobiota bacterium]
RKTVGKVIQTVTSGTEQTAAASQQVAQASHMSASGASEQASSIEEISATLEETSSMARQNADGAAQAVNLTDKTLKSAFRSRAVVEEMADVINRIKESTDETAKINKTIDEIAFQTNMLALNAAVEAARAGDAGRGFAVVAEEVRDLAQRSAEAADDTSRLIDDARKHADTGVNASAAVSDVLKEVVNGIEKSSQLINEISAASSEQLQGIEQINAAMADMNKVTQTGAANAEESASASEELAAQASEMQNSMNLLISIVNGTNLNGHGNGNANGSGNGHGNGVMQYGGGVGHFIAVDPPDQAGDAVGKLDGAAGPLREQSGRAMAPRGRAMTDLIKPEVALPLSRAELEAVSDNEEDLRDF